MTGNVSLGTRVRDLLHVSRGPLTEELLREPGGFGLGQLPVRLRPDNTTDMVCGYCSTGCSLRLHLRDGQAINLSPTADHPVNLGMACPKGWESLEVLDASDRAVVPLLKDQSRRQRPIDWDLALDTFVTRFRSIQERYGPDSIAFLGSGQLVTEEIAFLGALAKFGMGMLHGDGNTRQCMATAAVAYQQSWGFDAPPYTYADLEESDTIVLIGSNLCITHPILWQRIMRNPHQPEIIVIDPRMTETAMQATLHLPLTPKSDQTLFYGIARLLIQQGGIDRDFLQHHTHGFDPFAAFVEEYDLNRVVDETGLSADAVQHFAERINAGQRVSFWWTMGVNQSDQGVRTAQAIINLALITGNIGRPGTGANSITGQCNAMGSRLFSNTTCLLAGRDFSNPDHRRIVSNVLGISTDRIPSERSWAYHEILEGVLRKKIRGLWIVCTNPAHSWINQNQVRDVLSRLDFLVVQDLYHTTETARMADLLLPAAGWGEKEGTFINSERRIGLVKKVHRAPGLALADFQIFRLIADRWGCGEMFKKWTSPENVFRLLQDCSRGMPCDITGIQGYCQIDEQAGIQWPAPEKYGPWKQQRRLFENKRFFHADGRARILFEQPHALRESLSDRYPFLLLTGRGSASQWHTQTRTSKSAILRKLYPPEPFVEINPHDAKALGIRPNDSVVVESQRGRMQAMALITHAVARGQLFVPMHYAEANRLTDAVFDPYSKQPAYKSCAVGIRRSGPR